MFKTKIAAMALAGLLTIGGASVSALAQETTVPQPESTFSDFFKAAKAAELAEKKATTEAKAIEFAEKGVAFEEAQGNMQEKLSQSGKTQEEIDAILAKFAGKFEELKADVGANVAAKQAEREANTAARAEKGVVKGNITPA